jgi:hypothetical protein
MRLIATALLLLGMAMLARPACSGQRRAMTARRKPSLGQFDSVFVCEAL